MLAKIKQGGPGLRTAGCRDRQQPGPRNIHCHQQQQQQPCSVSCLTSSPDPDTLGSGVVDLTLWPPGECSLGLGYNLGFIRQEALSQAALCLIIFWFSMFTGHSPEQTSQHSILLTPSLSSNQYLQLTTLFSKYILTAPSRR